MKKFVKENFFDHMYYLYQQLTALANREQGLSIDSTLIINNEVYCGAVLKSELNILEDKKIMTFKDRVARIDDKVEFDIGEPDEIQIIPEHSRLELLARNDEFVLKYLTVNGPVEERVWGEFEKYGDHYNFIVFSDRKLNENDGWKIEGASKYPDNQFIRDSKAFHLTERDQLHTEIIYRNALNIAKQRAYDDGFLLDDKTKGGVGLRDICWTRAWNDDSDDHGLVEAKINEIRKSTTERQRERFQSSL